MHLNHLLLAVLVLLAPACAGPPHAPPDPTIQGTLGRGASLRADRSDGSSWFLGLEGDDVTLRVDGAEVLFSGGAPGGELRYRHDEANRLWILDLGAGEARVRGHELELAGRRLRLERGEVVRFGADGHRAR